jgi:hypothetical protein
MCDSSTIVKTLQGTQTEAKIVQIKQRAGKSGAASGFFCTASIETRALGKEVDRITFDGINGRGMNPVGYSVGVAFPEPQPSNRALVLIKNGDYDGRLIIIRPSGKIETFKGGRFFLTLDNKYLVSEYITDSDTTDYVVLTLPTLEPYWAFSGIGELERRDTGGSQYVLKKSTNDVTLVDLEQKQLKRATVPMMDSVAVKFAFDPRSYSDCTMSP